MNLSQELEIIKTVARMAAGVCQSIQAELVSPAQKDGREPVTIADYASQAIIGYALAENFPDDAVLAEERSEEFMLLLSDRQRSLVQRYVTDAIGGYVFEEQVCAWLDFGRGKEAARTWIVDPIDGTKGFLRNGHYCVAVAMLSGGEPVLGVLASPGFYMDAEFAPEDEAVRANGVLTYAYRGSGAYREELFGGPREPIQVSRATDPTTARVLTSFETAHMDVELLGRITRRLGRTPEAPQRGVDSQDKYAMIATGQDDIFLRATPDPRYHEKLWDHAAGYAIVTEAGGRVSDLNGKPLDWASGTRMESNDGVLVTNRFLHDTVLEAIAKVR